MKVVTTDGTWLDADRIMGFDSKPLDYCDWMELICKYKGKKNRISYYSLGYFADEKQAFKKLKEFSSLKENGVQRFYFN